MLHLVKLDRSYSPETIAVMSAAFDRVCQSLSRRMNENDDVRRAVAVVILRHLDKQRATQCGSPMSPSANWQALTARHTETVRQRDDCPLGQASPRLGRLAIPASVRSLVFCASPSPGDESRAASRVVPSHGVLWLGTLGHASARATSLAQRSQLDH
jgi:hypothetical protein